MFEPLSRTSYKMKLPRACLYLSIEPIALNRVPTLLDRNFLFRSFCAIPNLPLSFILRVISFLQQVPGYSIPSAVLLLNISHFLFNSLLHLFKKYNTIVQALAMTRQIFNGKNDTNQTQDFSEQSPFNICPFLDTCNKYFCPSPDVL